MFVRVIAIYSLFYFCCGISQGCGDCLYRQCCNRIRSSVSAANAGDRLWIELYLSLSFLTDIESFVS